MPHGSASLDLPCFIGSGVDSAANDADAALRPFTDRRASFEIFRADEVSLTSILFSGGDWRWRFRSAQGEVLAIGTDYPSEAACRAAVDALRVGAGTARVVSAH